jgi:hypothetical protein
MRNHETERFIEAVKNFTDNGMQAPSDARQAVRFIQGLDNTLYYEFKRSLDNGIHLGLEYPNTLSKALVLATNFRPIGRERTSANTSRENAVYHVSKNRKSSRNQVEYKSEAHSIRKGKNKVGDHDSNQCEQQKDDPKRELICWKCNKKGHKMKDCRSKDVQKTNYMTQAWDDDHEDALVNMMIEEDEKYQWEEEKEDVIVEKTNYMMSA